MSQDSVKNFLKKHIDGWFTTKEICAELKISSCSVDRNIRVLRRYNVIRRRVRAQHRGNPPYEYNGGKPDVF
jgi:predicted transcriptional regulator